MSEGSELRRLGAELQRLETIIHELKRELHSSRKAEHPANSADVTNPYVLQLGCSIWWGMMGDEDCIADMNKIQMQYAIDVADAASRAYTAIKRKL